MNRTALSRLHQFRVTDLPETYMYPYNIERYLYSTDDIIQKYRYCHNQDSETCIPYPDVLYTRLVQDNVVVMLDEPYEVPSNLMFLKEARGSILVTGLGLGVVVNMLCQKSSVTSVDVIEINEDIIQSVGNHYIQKYSVKVSILKGDAWTFVPSRSYDYAWHDFWTDQFPVQDISAIKDRYAPYIKYKQMTWLEHMHDARLDIEDLIPD